LKDGRPVDAVAFDEPQLELVTATAHENLTATGGPRPDPSRPTTPSR
jgi:hypothetical protein